MKSISKFVVAATVMLFASVASAGTLYWQVDDSSGADGVLFWVENKTSGDKWSLSEDGTFKTEPDSVFDAPTGVMQADITNYSGDQYLYYVELVNYANGTTTEGYKWGYGDLVSSGYVASDFRDAGTAEANAVALGNFGAAPEPSSGLLLLMGGAMLALRRRRQK